jgi:hypothetical protein
MSLSFNANAARKADTFASIIKETGKYEGVITRAEKLDSSNGTAGVGFSFKTAEGATANYLDVYTVKKDGETLFGANIVQAVLGCLGLKEVAEGEITFDKWTKDQGIVATKAIGYPSLMGKKIGFLLQRTLETHSKTGEDVDRVNIAAVFQAGTGLTSSEILDGVTKGTKTEQRLKALTPVWDRRKKGVVSRVPAGNEPPPPIEFDDIGDLKF